MNCENTAAYVWGFEFHAAKPQDPAVGFSDRRACVAENKISDISALLINIGRSNPNLELSIYGSYHCKR